MQACGLFLSLDAVEHSDGPFAEPAQGCSRHMPLEGVAVTFSDDHEAVVQSVGIKLLESHHRHDDFSPTGVENVKLSDICKPVSSGFAA